MDYARCKRQLIRAGAVLGTVAFFSSCYYDNFDELYPGANTVVCDSAAIDSYSKQVAPVLNLYCNSCHSTKTASWGIVLDTYDAVRSTALSGKLLGSIQHAPGLYAMPLNSTMDACYIREIQKWILAGSLNN